MEPSPPLVEAAAGGDACAAGRDGPFRDTRPLANLGELVAVDPHPHGSATSGQEQGIAEVGNANGDVPRAKSLEPEPSGGVVTAASLDTHAGGEETDPSGADPQTGLTCASRGGIRDTSSRGGRPWPLDGAGDRYVTPASVAANTPPSGGYGRRPHLADPQVDRHREVVSQHWRLRSVERGERVGAGHCRPRRAL